MDKKEQGKRGAVSSAKRSFETGVRAVANTKTEGGCVEDVPGKGLAQGVANSI